jgi:RNA polymerase sigma factor (sigma-70 family)
MEGPWARRTDDAQSTAGIADRRSFEHCFEELFPVVHRYLARRVGTALADDLAAETFAIAYRRREDYDPERGLARSWLYGIATNLLRNHWRAEQHLLQLDALLSSDVELRQDPDLSDDRLSASLVAPKLAAALSELTAERRDVFLLYVWADLSTPEIGDALGIPDGTVRSRLSRARAELRERLGDFNFDLWLFETPSASPQGGSDD